MGNSTRQCRCGCGHDSCRPSSKTPGFHERRAWFACRPQGSRIPHISILHVTEVKWLKEQGVIGSGMIPKVDSATQAIEAGVDMFLWMVD